MSVATDEYTAGITAGDFGTSPDPGETADQDAEPEAPYGYTTDPETGERRPKKRAGRPRKPPGPEELAAADPIQPGDDKPPRAGRRRKPPAGVPDMPKGGIIAAGVNRLYRKAGRIVRAMDHDIGTAIIECTRKEDPDDLTVGEAWEALCKANPRIRRFVLGCLKGGAWGDLVMAHAPIGVALFMKPAIQKMIPFRRVIEGMAEPDEDQAEGEGGLPGGMTAGDFDQMSELAQEQARKAFAKMGVQVSDAELAEAAAAAQANLPPAFRRAQPKRTTRAQRRA
jgi:hypothetical protein